MKFFQHIPCSPLNRFIDWMWYYEDLQTDHAREHVLPDATFELIINLSGEKRTLFGKEPGKDQTFHRAWLSGAQSEFLVIDALAGASMIGVHFKPGGAAPFLKMPASELCDEVVELDDVWGSHSRVWRERLLSVPTPISRFKVMEELLCAQMARVNRPQIPRRIGWALDCFANGAGARRISTMAEELGISHKHFIDEFRNATGLTPKLFCRIRRFQGVLKRIQVSKTVNWTDVAVACDYFDQAHFINDFQAFSGLNPTVYLRQRTDYPNFTRAEN